MSLVGDRAAIAEALTGVTGVRGYQFRPTAPRPGDAWPLLGSLEHAAGMAFMVTWRVLVFLPQDERAASDWTDTNYEALVDALMPVAFVDRIEPAVMSANGSDQYVLQITMRAEG